MVLLLLVLELAVFLLLFPDLDRFLGLVLEMLDMLEVVEKDEPFMRGMCLDLEMMLLDFEFKVLSRFGD